MAGPWDKYQASAPVPAMSGQAPWQKHAVTQPIPDAPAPTPQENLDRSWVLPLAKNRDTGGVEFAAPKAITAIPGIVQGMYEGLKSVASAPGDAMSGDLQVFGPDGHVSPEAIARSAEFATTVTPMAPGLRAGEAIIPGVKGAFKPVKVEPPTAQALKDAASEGYENLRNMDARYTSQSVADMANRLEVTLKKQGINDKTAPKTIASLRELQNPPPGGFASSSDIETIRRTFGEIGQDFANPTDRNAGKFVRGAVDSFVSRPPEGAVFAGSEEAAAQAGKLAGEARGNYAAGKRSDSLNNLVTAAEDRAGATNSGSNIGNNIRQRAASILGSPKASSGFTSDELDALREVARGTIPQNITRRIGNILGGGGGLGTIAAGAAGTVPGLAAGSPLMTAAGITLPVVGYGSKEISNVLTRRALDQVDKMTRKRSPLYGEMQRAAGVEPDVPVAVPSFLRALSLGGQGGQ